MRLPFELLHENTVSVSKRYPGREAMPESKSKPFFNEISLNSDTFPGLL